MDFYKAPVCRRTRLGWEDYYKQIAASKKAGSSTSKRDESGNQNKEGGFSPAEVVDVDEHQTDQSASKATPGNRSRGPSRSKSRFIEANTVDETSDEESDENEISGSKEGPLISERDKPQIQSKERGFKATSGNVSCLRSQDPSMSKSRFTKTDNEDETSDESEDEEESDENAIDCSSEDCDGVMEIGKAEFEGATINSKDCGPLNAFSTRSAIVYSLDDSNSDQADCKVDNSDSIGETSVRQGDVVEDFGDQFFPRTGIANANESNTRKSLYQLDKQEPVETVGSDEETEDVSDGDYDDDDYIESDELSSSSESDSSDDSDFLGLGERPRRQSSTSRDIDKVRYGEQPSTYGTFRKARVDAKPSAKRKVLSEVVRKEKIDSLPKSSRKEDEDEPSEESCNSNTCKGTNNNKKVKNECSGIKIDKVYGGKPKKRKLKINDDDIIHALLNPITADEENLETGQKSPVVDSVLPLKFKFGSSEDESPSTPPDESEVENLFQQLKFYLECSEIGPYRPPTVENEEKDGNDEKTTQSTHCQRGKHGDIYFEEQIGLRCCLCGEIVLESKDVIPTLANYAPDTSKKACNFGQKEFESDGLRLEASSGNPLNNALAAKGTVWELVPMEMKKHLYSHQEEGFEFLWRNLAGTVELSKLQKFDSSGGGGCIISHAPGTGKTLLTIVFIMSLLKKFPNCRPVIVVPASLLLTWEAEFSKWQVAFSFYNLNNVDHSSLGMVKTNIKQKKDYVRALKIRSWRDGGSVLGVSYSLFEKLARNKNKKDEKTEKNNNLEKMGNLLIELPGLVVLDEGHTPRNQRSSTWNVLLKLKTEKRIILSGTPFQNNFVELFNTLCLVRPATADVIGNKNIFSDIVQSRKRGRKPINRWGNFCYPVNNSIDDEEIDKLKATILPFVHVHKGDILQSKLPGLRDSVLLLNPPPLQKHLIENMETSGGLEYEHKVALMSVHPSLLLRCSNLSEKEKRFIIKEKLEKMRLSPDEGVKTRFILALICLSLQLNEKVLIFAQYIQPLKLIKDQITRILHLEDGRQVMLMRGNLNQKDRQKIINEFNDRGSDAKVLLASTKCCSEGIHLIGASRVVLLDVVWNPSVERQAISRAYRLGQKKVVYTYHLLTSGTIEEEKYNRQVQKERLSELVFSSSVARKAAAELLDDKILQVMVDPMKDIFKKVSNPKG